MLQHYIPHQNYPLGQRTISIISVKRVMKTQIRDGTFYYACITKCFQEHYLYNIRQFRRKGDS